MQRRDSRFPKKPVQEGNVYDITIEGIGSKGDGVGKVQGFVVIVPGVKEGETVKVKINAVRKKVAFGEAVGAGDPAKAAEDKGEAPVKEAVEDSEEAEETDNASEEDSEAESGETSEESEDSPEEEAPESDSEEEDNEKK